MNTETRLGFFAGLGAYFIWGSLPLYIRLMKHISAPDLLAHRVVWSIPTALIFIALAANWRDVRTALKWDKLKWLAVSGALIGANWGCYIWAVNADRTVEASLGYYINPLVNVLFGMIFFSERLRIAQWIAVGIATIGVGIMTIAFGHIPWVALFLCMTFAVYSLIRKQVAIDSRAGFLMEVLLLAPLALAWLVWVSRQPEAHVFGEGGWDIALLMAAGPITSIPLILFALSARRLKLSTVGACQLKKMLRAGEHRSRKMFCMIGVASTHALARRMPIR